MHVKRGLFPHCSSVLPPSCLRWTYHYCNYVRAAGINKQLPTSVSQTEPTNFKGNGNEKEIKLSLTRLSDIHSQSKQLLSQSCFIKIHDSIQNIAFRLQIIHVNFLLFTQLV